MKSKSKWVCLLAIIIGCVVAAPNEQVEDVEVLHEFEGPRTAALVSGHKANLGEHPWHVGLVKEESKTGVMGWFKHLGGLIRTSTYCGATLVSERWLVTAAHCIRQQDRPVDLRPVDLRVVMGTSKRAKHFYYFFQTDKIDEIHIHPDYNTTSQNYDIALLRLKKVPDVSPGELWPACLPKQSVTSYAGQSATVVGWGRTSSRSAARYLQDLEVNIISQEECQNHWGDDKAGKVEVGGPKMCFNSTGASCHGDSGGGMFIRKQDKEELVGVCSYGLKDCKNRLPEVYTKVSYVLDWIKKTIEDRDHNDDINTSQCGISRSPESSRTKGWPVWDIVTSVIL